MKYTDTDESNKLATKIKKARKEAGLSQKEISKLLKVSDKAISSYEVGRTQPTIHTLKKIGQITNKQFSYFGDIEEESDEELKMKLIKIEQELTEIKNILKKKQKK